MKVGLIGAMKPEIMQLGQALKKPQRVKLGSIIYLEGQINGVDVVLLLSGIGKVSAAIGTALMIHHFSPDYIINTGSAGGFVDSLAIGDIVVSEDVVHHDVDVTAFGYTMGQVPQQPATYAADVKLVEVATHALKKLGKMNYVKGLIGTGDSFICTPERTREILKNFPDMAACEMEAAAIAQTCHQLHTPFVIIRSLSDNANNDSPVDFDKYIITAGANSAELVMEMLLEIKDL
jgi:adenosylhomocysteine nucleosidase